MAALRICSYNALRVGGCTPLRASVLPAAQRCMLLHFLPRVTAIEASAPFTMSSSDDSSQARFVDGGGGIASADPDVRGRRIKVAAAAAAEAEANAEASAAVGKVAETGAEMETADAAKAAAAAAAWPWDSSLSTQGEGKSSLEAGNAHSLPPPQELGDGGQTQHGVQPPPSPPPPPPPLDEEEAAVFATCYSPPSCICYCCSVWALNVAATALHGVWAGAHARPLFSST